jgi:hypothetical protein
VTLPAGQIGHARRDIVAAAGFLACHTLRAGSLRRGVRAQPVVTPVNEGAPW